MTHEQPPILFVCKGPPICDLMDEGAIAAMNAECPWCQRMIMHPDGSETIIDMIVQ